MEPDGNRLQNSRFDAYSTLEYPQCLGLQLLCVCVCVCVSAVFWSCSVVNVGRHINQAWEVHVSI